MRTSLFNDIARKDLAAVRAAITPAGLLETDQFGRRPLAAAASRAGEIDVNIVRALLDAGADVHHAQGPEGDEEIGWTALHHACLRGTFIGAEEVVVLLLERGAHPRGNVADKGITPLYFAIAAHHLGITQRLLTAGADANAPVGNKTPPMHLACFEWSSRKKNKMAEADQMLREDVRVLLEHGASATARAEDGETALAKLLLHRAPSDVILALVKAGAPLVDKVTLGQGKAASPAAMAIGLGQPVEVLIAMLETGLDTEKPTEPEEQNLLHFAAMKRFDAVDAILSRRPNQPIDARDETMSTALFLASWSGIADSVNALLKRGATVDIADDGGNTPLHTAAKNNHVEVVNALLAAGANRSLKNSDGETPFDRASKAGHTALAENLRA